MGAAGQCGLAATGLVSDLWLVYRVFLMSKRFLLYLCTIALAAAAVFCQALYRHAADRVLVDQLVVAGHEIASTERTTAGDARALHALLIVCKERDAQKVARAERIYFEVELKKMGPESLGVGLGIDRLLEGLLFEEGASYPYPFRAEGVNPRLPKLQMAMTGKFMPMYMRLDHLEKTFKRRDLSPFLKSDSLMLG